jgi:hypothetical protein
MVKLNDVDVLDKLFIYWAFIFQIVLCIHFAIRKLLMQSYTTRFGWIVYALCIPAAVISFIILRGGKSWSFWLGGFLFVVYAAFGFWVDYVAKIQFRNPLRLSILIPYVILYLATAMFYWWPLGLINRRLWFIYAILFVIGTVLNVISH